jgi:hypothetical protein
LHAIAEGAYEEIVDGVPNKTDEQDNRYETQIKPDHIGQKYAQE